MVILRVPIVNVEAGIFVPCLLNVKIMVGFKVFFVMSKLRGFNPFESEIHCLEPQIILNPHFAELVAQYGNYTIKKEFVQLTGEFVPSTVYYRFTPFQVHTFKPGNFNADKLHVTLQDLDDCYVTDMSTGELFPVYFVVPCGHCLLCQNIKVKSFVRRCQYECQLYDCPPVHVTMTYDDQGLPDDGSVNLRHVQLWKKRVRAALDSLYYGRTLRFAVAAEYGHRNTRRPHYHVIIWNLKPNELFTYEFLHQLMYDCWYDEDDVFGVSMCLKKRFSFSPITTDYIPKGQSKSLAQLGKSMIQAFGYVAKYFYKQDDTDVPPGRKPVFHTFSKSKILGGIGAPFIDKHAECMRSKFYKQYKFADVFTGKVLDMPYDRYLLNRVFPSKYSIVPYKVRKCVQFLQRHDGLVPSLKPWVDIVFSKLSAIFPCFVMHHRAGFCFRARRYCPIVTDKLLHDMYVRSLWDVYDFFAGLDPSDVLLRDHRRKHLLSLLFSDKKVCNVNDEKIKLMRYRHRRVSEFQSL